MRKKYNADELYVANIVCLTDDESFKFFSSEGVKISERKYIFEKIEDDKYQEVFTGFITEEWKEFSVYKGVPLVHRLESYVELFPEVHGKKLSKIDLIISSALLDEKCDMKISEEPKKYSDDYDEAKQKRDTAAVKEFTKSSLFNNLKGM